MRFDALPDFWIFGEDGDDAIGGNAEKGERGEGRLRSRSGAWCECGGKRLCVQRNEKAPASGDAELQKGSTVKCGSLYGTPRKWKEALF